MNQVWKLGIIGAGGISREHLKAARKDPRITVSAIADVSLELAEDRAKEFAIPSVYGNYSELLEQTDIDAVIICLPNYLHAPVTLKAFANGKHVLCEKPLALHAQEAQMMLDASRAAGRILMTGMNNRFRSEVIHCKRLIEQAKLGNIYHAKAAWVRRNGIPGWGSWFTQKEKSGGGPLIDLGVHMLDATLWLLDFPKPHYVMAQTYAKFGPKRKGISEYGTQNPQGFYDVEDMVTALVQFENGSTLSLEVSWASHIEQEQAYIQLLGDEAGARISFEERQLVVFEEQEGMLADKHIKSSHQNERSLLISHFIDVLEGKDNLCQPEQGVYMNQLIDAIYLSAQRREPVLFS
ncbi:Gfo/Idh/MocA family protein [Brevibacillus sp. SYSU BS000544]|uniref:Gfo/Idh/MocA family protein n=1 Tax=Brevibacillus sp. SYSU BS000544 TaxID=3416443 RepID=UPI003CE5237B